MFFYGAYYDLFDPQTVFQPYAVYLMPNELLQPKIEPSASNTEFQVDTPPMISTDLMLKQLEKRHKRSKSKFWSEEQDSELIKLTQEGQQWHDIARNFEGKNQQICKRRYQRLVRQNQKWPKQNERLIKHLYQVQKLSWKQIQKYLPMYTVKQIKERYNNFLQVQIKRSQWTIEQDLKLWKMVKEQGKKWVNFTKIFDGRSQLQLKNRYNKLIKPLEKTILSTTKTEVEDQSDGQWQCDS